MSDGRPVSGQLKKYVFRGKSSTNGDTRGEYLEIVIPELLTAGYSFYTWPSAPLLAWYLWTQRRHLRGLRVLELGCGTGLPGILAAKCGARVTLTDSVALPRSLRHLSACCEANGLVPSRDVQILGLAWGLFLADVHNLRPVDLLLASDCFYEPSQFEEVLSVVAYLLDGTDGRFLCAYQERSADWSIEALLKKWGLKGSLLDLDSLSESSGVDYRSMAEGIPEYPDSDFSDEELSPLDISFNKAADHVRKLTSKLDNNQLLELYGLFKQGTEGTCNTPKPGWLDGRGRRKWEAWKALGDMPKDEARQKYVALVQKYDPNTELSSPTEKGQKELWVAVSSLRYSPEPELDHQSLSVLEAAREDLGDLVTELLTKNPELKHKRDEDGLTALHWAADRDATKALAAALKAGCPVDGVDECGQTALHYAAACGHIRSTQILIDAGASLLKDEDDCTPLDVVTDGEVRKILEGAAK
ncbi:acyl-CoA-binding domain-containing protein 6-like [Pectinophora gossypiella]|uniref:acyl-CoA-binding domain-containing protein 6-like n=1 Tax=Pectinophora gossypiella TaxID=13191 RepID=UPI00214E6004|nr:acyl-CoA-binding domain-containing protein 6-like [Pectinophora gossypiella]